MSDLSSVPIELRSTAIDSRISYPSLIALLTLLLLGPQYIDQSCGLLGNIIQILHLLVNCTADCFFIPCSTGAAGFEHQLVDELSLVSPFWQRSSKPFSVQTSDASPPPWQALKSIINSLLCTNPNNRSQGEHSRTVRCILDEGEIEGR